MARKREKKQITVGLIALGCPKNIVDSEKILANLVDEGFVITADIDNANVVLVNTCGFIAPAKQEAIDHIRHALKLKKKGNVQKVIVTGCLAERLGEAILDEVPGIDAVIGLTQREQIAQIIRESLKSDEVLAALEHDTHFISDDRSRLLITPTHSPYLRISEGCDHKCSFCTIPAIRGPFRSKPKEMILAEADELARAGAVELNIIAQDTAYYGKDLKIKDGLADLLKELERIDPVRWIRLLYLYPVGITDALIDTIAGSKKILRYFDIPIQHISNRVLKDMRRPDSKELITSLIEKLRQKMPDIALRTTVIVGFPGETEDEFSELLDFVTETRFDALGAFTYYAEKGTPAAERADQVDDAVKQERLERLMLTQQQIAFEKNKNLVGQKLTCLIDSVDENNTAFARSYAQAPEIDSICIVENCSASAGEFITVEVTGSSDYDLVCKQIKC